LASASVLRPRSAGLCPGGAAPSRSFFRSVRWPVGSAPRSTRCTVLLSYGESGWVATARVGRPVVPSHPEPLSVMCGTSSPCLCRTPLASHVTTGSPPAGSCSPRSSHARRLAPITAWSHRRSSRSGTTAHSLAFPALALARSWPFDALIWPTLWVNSSPWGQMEPSPAAPGGRRVSGLAEAGGMTSAGRKTGSKLIGSAGTIVTDLPTNTLGLIPRDRSQAACRR